LNYLGPHVVFAGGGTAGHLMPGIATAEYLAQAFPSTRITFALTGRSLEKRLVASAGFESVVIPSRPLPRSASEAFGFISASFSGYRAASRFAKDERVSVVAGLGGYGSVPMARAALRRRLPLVLLEQNAMPGRATRWFANSATAVCLAFAEAQEHLRDDASVRVTGNPVRPSFTMSAMAPDRFTRSTDRVRQLVVLGGSGGSRVLNEQVPRALYKSRTAIEGWRIVHQTGERNVAAVRELYRKFGLAANVSSFFEDVPQLLGDTDLAISRAGGTTLAELAALAVPSILVPYENAADNHQRVNADVYRAAHAAELIDPREIEGRLDDQLAQSISHLAQRPERRRQMSEAIHDFAQPDASRAVVKIIREALSSRQLASVA
jgi:UDP-N-acetylglucosamine--N-acetylmuramyl-(pentapeptide) pyrophosphoryl-undecaprenol N-acetylglucosamine transferase